MDHASIRPAERGDLAALVSLYYAGLQSVIVTKAFRRRGLGSLLVQVVWRWAEGRGAEEVRLDSWEFEAAPLRFYEERGYRTLRRTMERPLARADER
jgi:GNAT superfamily N-acetyltransferase